MASHISEHPESRQPGTASTGNSLLLVLALILLVAGFPFLVFGSFLVAIEGQGAIDGGRFFAVGGLVAVACALGLRGYLRRQDGWF